MKLFILKLLSLLVLCLGLISGAYALGLSEVTGYLAQLPGQLAELRGNLPENFAWAAGALDLKILWLVASISAIVFGIYGFLPRSTKWKKPKKITYDGPHGLVQIQLDTVEDSLNRVLARMPEVKKINVTVEPREGGRSALIKASAVLQHQAGQNARAIAGLVSDYIAETATKMLGLEELATIELNILGISVNSRKSSKVIRKGSLSNSSNAPVELLEAAPKPMALAAPGEPLGSGPVEEELEDGVDDAVEARAVDSVEEESNQAAARSELLEPLSLHEPETAEKAGDTGESPEKAEESVAEPTPDIGEPVVAGNVASVQIVPEPLGDLADDDTEGEEVESDVAIPEVEALEDVPTAPESNAKPEEALSSPSPWTPLNTEPQPEPEPETEVPSDFDSSDAVTTEADEDTEEESTASIEPVKEEEEEAVEDVVWLSDTETDPAESTDSLVGDLDSTGEEAISDSALDSDAGEDGEGDGSTDAKKKGWGWFN